MESILIATITALGVIGAAAVASHISTRNQRKRHDEIKDTLGQPNGEGNIVEMLEKTLRWQGAHQAQDERNFEQIATALGVELD